jgi:hypothetical protein
MNQGNEAIPVSTWIRMDMEVPALPTIIAFTHVDHEAGLSAAGGSLDDPNLGKAPSVIVRLAGPNPGLVWEPLSEEEIGRLHLPRIPVWLHFYGPQPKPTTHWGEWRHHPKLQDRFHLDWPDDLQVLVHDGGQRITKNRPEVVWVRMTGMDGEIFRGLLLNRPSKLKSIRQWDEVLFVVAEGAEYPIRVTEKYLREREDWIIHSCDRCGLSELFDAPSDLLRVVFPNSPKDGVSSMFTAFCPLCGGVQVVVSKSYETQHKEEELTPPSIQRRWWQFWR